MLRLLKREKRTSVISTTNP